MYWSSILRLCFSLIVNVISLKTYKEIKRYLHFTNSDAVPVNNSDSFVEIRCFLNLLEQSAVAAATPVEAINEMNIPFKGKSRAKQYLMHVQNQKNGSLYPNLKCINHRKATGAIDTNCSVRFCYRPF